MVSPIEVVLIVAATLAVLGIASLIRHRKFGVLLTLLTLSGALVAVSWQLREVRQNAALDGATLTTSAAADDANVDEQSLLHHAVSKLAEVATDAELAAIAAAEPQIDLDSEGADAYRRQALEAAQETWDAERIRANDEAYGRDAEAKRIKFLEAALREAGEDKPADDNAKPDAKKRPAWANGDVAENQTVITSGPFTTAESCKEDARQQLLFWLPFMKNVAPSEAETDDLRALLASQSIDLDQFIKAQHAETRDTSVGEVHLLYTLAEMNPEIEVKVEKAANDFRVRKTQSERIGAVTFLGAGMVSLVALAHMVLRAGGRKAASNAS